MLDKTLARIDPAEAWQPRRPDDKQPFNLKWAGHLLRRAGFAPSWAELQETLKAGPGPTVERLLKGPADSKDLDGLVDDTAKGLSLNARGETLQEYQALWLYRMIHTAHPLQERMVLFWHDHFATSLAKVRKPELMQKQNALLRQHALGKFGPLLLAMSRDPAMLIWLDSNSNVKGAPNENYAREVMELFSLGVGNYTEKDVQEAARAFTGWHTVGNTFVFNKTQHDFGGKTVLGQTGNFDGHDIVRIVLEQPAAGRFLAGKLFHEFISENAQPPAALLEPLALQLRKTDYDLSAALRTVLSSKLFFSGHAYRQRIKSPVEFMVGLVRSLQGESIAPRELAGNLEGMGQKLYMPPSVKGWDGGKAWLNSATILARHNLAWALIGGNEGNISRKLDAAALAREHAKEPKEQVAFLLDLFLQGDVDKKVPAKLVAYLKDAGAAPEPKKDRPEEEQEPIPNATDDLGLRETAHTILLLPEYQLA